MLQGSLWGSRTVKYSIRGINDQKLFQAYSLEGLFFMIIWIYEKVVKNFPYYPKNVRLLINNQ